MTTVENDSQIERLRRLHARATPGNWKPDMAPSLLSNQDFEYRVFVDGKPLTTEEDATFAAAAYNDLPAVLDALDVLTRKYGAVLVGRQEATKDLMALCDERTDLRERLFDAEVDLGIFRTMARHAMGRVERWKSAAERLARWHPSRTRTRRLRSGHCGGQARSSSSQSGSGSSPGEIDQ